MPVTYSTYQYNSETQKTETTWHVDAFKGATIRTWFDSVRIMSDVWETYKHALVWNTIEQKPETIILFHGEKSDLHTRSATADATEEVMEAYRQYLIQCKVETLRNDEKDRIQRQLSGKTVKVVRGRKDQGKVGKVVFTKQMPYQMGYRTIMKDKLCIALDDRTVKVKGNYGKVFDRYVNTAWVWASNVDIVNPEQYQSSDAELLKRATEIVNESIIR